MPLGRDDILGRDDLPRQLVAVPEWGGEVWVRTLTAAERDAWEASIVGDGGARDLGNLRARLAARAMCDESGARLFADADAEALGCKSAVALGRVYDVAARLSGVREDDVERLEKN